MLVVKLGENKIMEYLNLVTFVVFASLVSQEGKFSSLVNQEGKFSHETNIVLNVLHYIAMHVEWLSYGVYTGVLD